MSWNDTLGVGGGKGKGENYISVKPNQTVKIHALLDTGEEPRSYWTHFIRGKGSVICPGRDTCPICKEGRISARRQHSMNVYDYDSNSVKILEQGNQVYQQIKMIFDQYGSLDGVDLNIKRVGEGRNDTQYFVMPLPLTAPFKFSPDSLAKFDLDILKSPDSPEKIKALMNGVGGSEEAGFASSSQVKATSAPPVHTSGEQILSFGKYAGKTMQEIAQIDMNYVKWCAKNITDPTIKKEAENVVLQESGKPVGTPMPTNVDVLASTKAVLITEAYTLINSDERYKGNMNAVVGKMKQATATPQNPNGKMLLQDYTEQELTNFIKLLKEV